MIVAGIFIFGLWYISVNYDRFASGVRFNSVNISLLIGLNILTVMCESFRLRLMIRKLGYPLSFLDSWHIFSVLQAVNHMVLKAGTFSAGYYMSRKYHISFHAYIAFVVPYIVIITLASGVFGLLVSAGFAAAGFTVEALLPAFFLLVIFICACFVAIASLRIPIKLLPRLLKRVISCWREIYSDYHLVVTLTAVEMFYFLFCSLRFMVAVSMFSGNVNFLDSTVVVTIGNFLRGATIVPGGLGIAEVASGWTAALRGADAGLSGLAAGLDRLVYVIVIMLFGGVGFLTLSGRSEFHKPPEQNNILSSDDTFS